MNFDWDPQKNEENIGNHHLDLADAHEIFDGPMLEKLDSREEYGEDRYVSIGFLRNIVVVVVYSERGETVRLISLRKALKYERTEFERYLADELGTFERDDGSRE